MPPDETEVEPEQGEAKGGKAPHPLTINDGGRIPGPVGAAEAPAESEAPAVEEQLREALSANGRPSDAQIAELRAQLEQLKGDQAKLYTAVGLLSLGLLLTIALVLRASRAGVELEVGE